ncbi:hypothetical protein K440DRAFT_634216 [Wilcoxina mikolae CBS 423.85]|nr:hypothetical protein K440DRAFT_634216 [Wilcoxina mikolae CBS 423.85]
MPPKNVQQLATLEENIRFGDISATLERADFWRAYTTSLLFQNQQVQSRLNAVDIPASELGKLLGKVQVPRRSVAESPLRELIRSVMHLTAQLRCQRGVYEVDDSIRPGQRYEDERMVDPKNPDLETDEASRASVRAVLSNGLVWKSFTGAGAVEERIFKARVVVVIAEEVEDGNGDGQSIAGSQTYGGNQGNGYGQLHLVGKHRLRSCF